MLFNSFEFLVFFALLLPLYYVSGKTLQNRILLIASYIFYGSWDWRFLGLILFSTVVDYICGKAMEETSVSTRKKRILYISLVNNLGLLAIFKYFGFFVDSFMQMLENIGIDANPMVLNIVLPVGISFYTFQTLSYTIDIYRNEIKAERNFWDFALFVSFFPQLVAGPIERAKSFIPQIKAKRTISWLDIQTGAWLIFFGLFLKVFVADNLAVIVDHTYNSDGPVTGSEALLATYAFAFQIFGDFAGYSSIAIGIARLMGFHLMTNFLYPYFVTNPSQFWRNWHISLSSWLRDYLYISLGGNRGGELFTYRNLFLTMLLGGLWHGAAWTFVLWGFYQGSILVLHRLYRQLVPKPQHTKFAGNLWTLIKIIIMFQFTCLGWMIFRAQSLDQISVLLTSIFTDLTTWTTLSSYYLKSLLFYCVPVLVISYIQFKKQDLLAVAKLPYVIKIPALTIILFCILSFGEFNTQEFIYFQF